MTRLGITGHQAIPAEALNYITQGVRAILAAQNPPLVGYSSLAVGADQLFAGELLEAGGILHAVVPSNGYESTFSDEDLVTYRQFLAVAAARTDLAFSAPDEDAYDAAGKWIVKHSDVLVAVWDGEDARGRGGTADAVAYAHELGRVVHVIWPIGTKRR